MNFADFIMVFSLVVRAASRHERAPYAAGGHAGLEYDR
jgi:hypothetical protein